MPISGAAPAAGQAATLSAPKRSAEEIINSIKQQIRADQKAFNALVYSFPKVGKTHLLRTARKPVLLFQFDPNGHAPLEDLINSGDVLLVDFSREDDPSNPVAFKTWEKTLMEYVRAKVFDNVGTVAIDSATNWIAAMSMEIFKRNGRPFKAGGVEFFHGKAQGGSKATLYEDRDYGIQLVTAARYAHILVSQPCDTLLMCHARDHTDRKTEKRTFQPLLAGQLAQQIPSLFDEVYALVGVRTKDGYERRILTQPNGFYETAGSRYAQKLNAQEPADLSAILTKLGFPLDRLAKL